MLARALRLLIAGLALAAFGVAWWLGVRWELGPGAAALIAAALFFAVPALMILLTFAIAWRHRTVLGLVVLVDHPDELAFAALLHCALRHEYRLRPYRTLQPGTHVLVGRNPPFGLAKVARSRNVPVCWL